MASFRVASSEVANSLRALANANGKRNLRAYKVVVDGSIFYFEWAKAAHSFASRKAQMQPEGTKKVPVKVFENAGGEQYILLATYQFESKTSKTGIEDLNYVRMPNTQVAKGDTSSEAWAFALRNPRKVATIVRGK